MPGVNLGENRPPWNVPDEALADLKARLEAAGVPGDDTWVAALVKASRDDGFAAQMMQAVRSGAWPKGLMSVFRQLEAEAGQGQEQEQGAPAMPQAMDALAGMMGGGMGARTPQPGPLLGQSGRSPFLQG